jgi:hypothetical protein
MHGMMSSVEVQHHTSHAAPLKHAESREMKSAADEVMEQKPAAAAPGSYLEANEALPKTQRKDPPPSSVSPDVAIAQPVATTAPPPPPAAQLYNPLPEKPGQSPGIYTLTCRESMPPFFDFSDLKNPPQINMLPHVIATVSYVAVQEALLPRRKRLGRKRPACISHAALEKLERRVRQKKNVKRSQPQTEDGAERWTTFSTTIKPVTRLSRSLKNLPEVIRLKGHAMTVWPLEQDIPLCYDWGPASSLQLGSSAGSNAWNRILVLETLRKLAQTVQTEKRHDDNTNSTLLLGDLVASTRVPQISAVDFLVAFQRNLRAMTLRPPLSFEKHDMASSPECPSSIVGADDDDKEDSSAPSVTKSIVAFLSETRNKLFDVLQKLEADDSYKEECHLLSADQIVDRLIQFEKKVRDLDVRQAQLMQQPTTNVTASGSKKNHTTSTTSTGSAVFIPAAVILETSSSTPTVMGYKYGTTEKTMVTGQHSEDSGGTAAPVCRSAMLLEAAAAETTSNPLSLDRHSRFVTHPPGWNTKPTTIRPCTQWRANLSALLAEHQHLQQQY